MSEQELDRQAAEESVSVQEDGAVEETVETAQDAPAPAEDAAGEPAVDGEEAAEATAQEADPAAAQTCTAQAQRLSEEKEDQLNGAVLTSSELGNYGTDEKHCVVYGVSGEWEGQIVDPEITLETASADA